MQHLTTGSVPSSVLIEHNQFRSYQLPGEGEADGVLQRHVARLRHGLDHAAVGDAHLRDGSDARRRGEQPPPPRLHHGLEVCVARDYDQDARTHVALVSAMQCQILIE